MRLRLKEDPKEWRNFALLCFGFLLLIASIGLWRGWISKSWFAAVLVVALVGAALAVTRPRAFRRFYRAAMTVSFAIGQVVGKVILGLVYLLVVTPMGWLLRIYGKDLLQIRSRRNQDTYWKTARPPGKLEQQF